MRTGQLAGVIGLVVLTPLLVTALQDPRPQEPRFRADANLVRVDVYPTIDGQPVRDLKAEDFEVLEDGTPQVLSSFEHVQIRGAGPQESRIEPNTPRQARAMAAAPRARLFVVFLDTYFTDITGSHRIQRSLTNMLNQVVGEDDIGGGQNTASASASTPGSPTR